MKLKACSIFLGYREFDASVQREGSRYFLHVDKLGALAPAEYIRHGFRILQAQRHEVEALVAAGYESKRILLRF